MTNKSTKSQATNTDQPVSTSAKADANTPITAQLAELNERVEWFYGEDFSLDQATAHYKDTLKLANSIETDLKNLKNEINVLSRDFSLD